MLRKSPDSSAVGVLTLALGIGVTTAIFSATNDFLLRPLPFTNPDRLVLVNQYNQKVPQSGTTDPPSFKYWQEQSHVFKEMAAWSETSHEYNLTGAEGPERVSAKQVSAGFFHVLGVRPILGRTFSAPEDGPSRNNLAVISHSLWLRRYGGSPGVLGKAIILDGSDYTVIGVLPPGFRFSTTPEDVWTPVTISPAALAVAHGSWFLNVIARLKPGVTLAQAQADMDAIAAQWGRQFPDWWSVDQKVAVESLRDRYARDLRPALLCSSWPRRWCC